MRGRRCGVALVAMVVSLAGAAASAGRSDAALPIGIGAATLSGKPQAILVDARGQSLYYLTSDTPTASACTQACRAIWPPVLSDSVPPAPASIPAPSRLGIARTANGSQVEYDGHPLYRFSGDHETGDVNGEGKHGPQNGTWHVATPEL